MKQYKRLKEIYNMDEREALDIHSMIGDVLLAGTDKVLEWWREKGYQQAQAWQVDK